MTAWGAYLVKSSRNLNTPKAEVGIGLMMPAHHSSRCDFHYWIWLLLFIASPQGTELKIQVQSCWKSLADRLLQEFAMFSFVDISFIIYLFILIDKQAVDHLDHISWFSQHTSLP